MAEHWIYPSRRSEHWIDPSVDFGAVELNLDKPQFVYSERRFIVTGVELIAYSGSEPLGYSGIALGEGCLMRWSFHAVLLERIGKGQVLPLWLPIPPRQNLLVQGEPAGDPPDGLLVALHFRRE